MADLAEAIALWHLDNVVEIANTHSSMVYRAGTQTGRCVIVKILKPAGLGELPGLDYLDWRQGHGSVALLARHDNISLLEDAGNLTLRDFHASHGDEAANNVFAALLQRLHAPSETPFPNQLVPLADHFQALLDDTAYPYDAIDGTNVAWAAQLARALLADQTDIRPLHGDLHHDNVISHDAATWTAIDAHGLVGDAAYDAANIFGNPLGNPELVLDPVRVDMLANVLAPILGCSVRKVLSFAAVHAALSACWSLAGSVSHIEMEAARARLALLAILRGKLA